MGPLSTLFKHPGVPEYCCRLCTYIYDLLMATCSRVTQHVSEIKQHLKLFSWTQQGLQKYQSFEISQSVKAPQSALTLLLSYHHGPKSHINCGSYFLPVDILTDHFMKYTLQLGWTCWVLPVRGSGYLSSRCFSVVYNHYSHSDLWLLTSQHGIFLHATAARDQSTEEVRASGQDAYWTRFWGGVLGIPCEEEGLGQTQDLLKRLSACGVYTVYTACLATTTMSLQQVLFTMSTCLNASICLLPRGWLRS